MRLRHFAMLLGLVFATFPTFAQQASMQVELPQTSSEAEMIKAFQNAPMRRATGTALVDGAAQSYNWGGYAVTGTDFTEAKGSWTVPTVDCTKSPNAWVAFWVGIDGFSSSTVEQTGTLTWCNRTTAEYYTWYELYPAALTLIPTVPSKHGDKMSAQVTYNGSKFKLEITDETTTKSFSISKAVASAERTSAEWIAEAPEAVTGILNLADFTKVGFTGASATDTANSGPISSFGSSVQQITQIDDTDYTESTSSALSSSGSGFSVTWVEYN
jgi:3-dehydroquinate dehydratase